MIVGTLNQGGYETMRMVVFSGVDIILLDGTFWNDMEIKNRNIADIPHQQSQKQLGDLAMISGRSRVVFHPYEPYQSNPR